MINNRRTAIVIGATGLVGGQLTRQLLEDKSYTQVVTFVRRDSGVKHQKLQEIQVDFDKIDEWSDQISGDALFSALGTTQRQAGSKEGQYKVDFTYQYQIAQAAFNNSVPRYALVSSTGADSTSKNFYLKTKGELEEAAIALGFSHTVIMQPSFLEGERQDSRVMEKIGSTFFKGISAAIPPLKKYKPIHGATVAKAMIRSVEPDIPKGVNIYKLNEITELAER